MLLAALALSLGRVVTNDRLADALWHGYVPASYASVLRNVVMRLRKALGSGAIDTHPTGYLLVGDGARTDASRFEDAVLDAREECRSGNLIGGTGTFQAALNLWRGDPLPELQEWAPGVAEAARLEELRACVREELCDALLACGHHPELVAELETMVDEAPLRERRWGLLALALYRDGRQADAFRSFQRARASLGEIGLVPGTQLQSLERAMSTNAEALMASSIPQTPAWSAVNDRLQLARLGAPVQQQDPKARAQQSTEVRATDLSTTTNGPDPRVRTSVGRPSNLPHPVDTFVGREFDLTRLADGLNTHRLVTVLGPGGMGKTRLSLEAARRSCGFVDGIWLVQLGSVPPDGDVDLALASTLGLRTQRHAELADTVAEWCKRFDALVILDNCEHLLNGVASLAASVLERGPAATLLATSRERLGIAGEHVLPVGPLRLEAAGDAPCEAVALLIERTTSTRPDFDPTESQPVLARICARLDGMPLAIELAAARLRTLSPTEVADRLEQRFRLLTGGSRTATHRHTTLRATVDWSYDLLNKDQQRLFERLAVFFGPFDVDDVAAIHSDLSDDNLRERLQIDAAQPAEAVNLLGDLANRSLITVANTDPPYRLLETLRAYGLERLRARGGLDDVRHLHAAWFASKAAGTRLDACGPDDHRVWQLAVAQLPDYQAAATWAFEHGQPNIAVDIPADLTEAFWIRNGIGAADWGGRLATQVTSAVLATQARAHWLVGCRHQSTVGDLAASGRALETALRLDPTSAFCHLQASLQAVLTGELDEMREQANRGLALAGDDPSATAGGYIMLSNCAYLTAHADDAVRYADVLLNLASQREWPLARGFALYLQARVDARSSPEKALNGLRAALEIGRKIEAYALVSVAQIELVSLMIEESPRTAAAEMLDLLRHPRRQLRRVFVSQALATIVILLHRCGDLVRATEIATRLPDPMSANIDRSRYDDTVAALRARLGEGFDDRAEPADPLDLVDVAMAALTQLASRGDSPPSRCGRR